MAEVAEWSPELRRQAGALAAKRLQRSALEAHAIAMGLVLAAMYRSTAVSRSRVSIA
jgi:hypothetical protein